MTPNATPAAPSPMARWSTILIVAVATIRCTVAIVPQVRFDTDPAVNAVPYVGLGPAGSFALDLLLLVASALAFTAEVRAGRRVRGWLVALAALPAISVVWHGQSDAIDLFRGSTWVAAAIAAVAAMHLARDPGHRRLLIAGAVATLALLAIRGAEQVLIEHAETVRSFEANKAQFFAERGWDPLGAAARSYERRLRQPEAGGWFGLANVFSAAMAFGVVYCAGLSTGRWRAARAAGDERGRIALMPALLLLGCAALLLANGSKGAVVATGLGLMAWAIGNSRVGRFAPMVGVAMLLLAAAAPALRGLLPESFAGERSLLFRAQYLDGALRAIAESMPWGVGPDGFQDAYVRLKSPRSPEDVQSAHAMAIDWLVTLGPLALGWCWLAVAALWRGGRSLAERAAAVPPDAPQASVLAVATMIGTATILVGALAEMPIVSGWWVIVRITALVAYVCTFASIAGCADGRNGRLALWAATIALLAQAQIEMVFFMPGLCVWAAIVVGAMAASEGATESAIESIAPRRMAFSSLWPAAVASIVVAFGLVPQVAQDRAMDEASEALAPVAELREAWPAAREALRRGETAGDFVTLASESGGAGLGSEIRQAIRAATTPPMRVAAAAGVIATFERDRRMAATERLLAAREANPANWQAERAAIDQLLAASRREGAFDVTSASFAQALALADEASRHWRSPRFASLRAEIAYQRGRAAPDAASIGGARQASAEALALEPHSVRRWTVEGDLRAAAGDLGAAVEAWKRALEADADRALDPLVQLSPAEREAIATRIRTAEDAMAGRAPVEPFWPLTLPEKR